MTAPAAMTYDSLVSDIETYAERTDTPFTDQVPRFIMMAENKLAAETKPLGYVRVVSGSLAANTMVKPSRWRRTKSFSILTANTRSYLFERSYEYCRTYWPDATQTGTPRYYSDYDYETFFIAPTPSASFIFELSYFERPEPLSSTQQTSWLTQYAPQVILYACMVEAMPFLKLPEQIPVWQGLLDRALMSIAKEDESRIVDSAGQRN